MKVVLDTNCLLVALPEKSPYRCVWDAFCQGKFWLFYSTEILHEYEEVDIDTFKKIIANSDGHFTVLFAN